MGHHSLSPRSAGTQRHIRLRGLFFLIFGCILFTTAVEAQTAQPLVKRAVNPDEVTTLAHHHPQWATAANASAAIASDRRFDQMVVVLARPAAQEQALEAFIVRQQTPGSADYHHWLTPEQVGERFGPAQSDIDAVTNWLASQGLEVGTLSPSRTLLRFSGTASTINQAFGTTLHNYTVNGTTRYAVASEPTIPVALANAILAVRGLVQPDERPQHMAQALDQVSPQYTIGTSHYLMPADFNTIYNVPSAYTGAGYTIGIVSWSRVNTADLTNYNAKTGTNIAAPTVVIPTAYGGIDPGTACTSTTCSLDSTTKSGQMEATLDVIRAGSTAPGASLLLVASKYTATHNGIGEDTEYLVETSPVPAQIISISFGGCETGRNSADFAFWDNLFQTAAPEGISVFVSSGDSGASGCETTGSTPTSSSAAISPNYICASQYATCVGGTQFIDPTGSSSTYWSTTNSGTQLKSALGYIPEGAWNESTTSKVSGTGGGVSTLNTTTPSWQTGTGVPAARAGRYTPDISFSSALHDGYLGCMALYGGDCSSDATTLVFSGTSAAAPSMAGIAALLDQKTGAAQGNLNPHLYALASGTNASAVFNDVTVSTSGVSTCDTTAPSVCNNSMYSSTLGAVTPGYAVTAGYDMATGLGSLNVANFLNDYSTASTVSTPTVAVTPSASSITTAQSLTVSVAVSGSGTTPTGSVTLSGGGYTSSATALSSGAASFTIPASTFSAGTVALTATYTPDSSSTSAYTTATGSASITVTTVAATTPTVTVTPSATSITTAQSLTVAVAVTGSGTTPTGTVTLAGGGYTSSAATLSNGTASFTIAAGALSAGSDTLTATYTPSTSTYTTATGTATVTVTTAATATVTISSNTSTLTVTKGTTSGNTATITLTPGGGFTGTVALSATITSSPSGATSLPTLALSSNTVTISGAAQTATLTVTTSAATSAAAHTPEHPWMHTGGVALAGLLLLLPWRRKNWRALVGALLLCIALGSSLTACSSGSSKSTGGTGSTGTTAGNYTITIAGTASGVTISSQTITLTVQ